MNILFCSDDGYFIHAATAIHSAWLNNRDAHFFLADSGIDPAALKTFGEFAASIGLRLTVVRIEPDQLADIPATMTNHMSNYLRLLLARMLPATVKRVIYLDSDLVVIGDLGPLWSMDLEGGAIAGVQDDKAMHFEMRRGSARKDATKYLNSGVLLIDLAKWRESDCEKRLIDVIGSYERLPHHDQSAINLALPDEALLISTRWNFIPVIVWDEDHVPEQPVIVHYAGACKPWLHTDALFGELYSFHRKALPFDFEEPVQRYRSRARYLLNLAFLRPKYFGRLIWERKFGRALSRDYLQQAQMGRG